MSDPRQVLKQERKGFWRGFTALLYRLRTEADTPLKQAASVAVGVMIGCWPVYGLHLALCIVVGRVLRLSRLTMYLASNLSNPFVAPFLVYAEIQTGSVLRRGRLYGMSLATLREIEKWGFAHDLIAGSVVVGAALGAVLGLLTFAVLSRRRLPRQVTVLLEHTARRYLDAGIVHWEFVRGKLRHDPAFLELVTAGRLPSHGRLLDLGCGRGILLSLLDSYLRQAPEELPVGWARPPAGLELHGVDWDPRAVRVARLALGGAAVVELADLRVADLERCRGIVMLDVLHYLSQVEQHGLLARVAAALEPGGVLFLREVDATRSWRLMVTIGAERLRALLRGRPGQRFAFWPARQLQAHLEDLGLTVTAEPMSRGTPFSNVLLTARKAGVGPASRSGEARGDDWRGDGE